MHARNKIKQSKVKFVPSFSSSSIHSFIESFIFVYKVNGEEDEAIVFHLHFHPVSWFSISIRSFPYYLSIYDYELVLLITRFVEDGINVKSIDEQNRIFKMTS